jgi:hypothetical protein
MDRMRSFQGDAVQVDPLGVKSFKLHEMKTSQLKLGKGNFLRTRGQLQTFLKIKYLFHKG